MPRGRAFPTMGRAIAGCIINLISSTHPHFKSLLSEGLWGFPDNKLNRRRWSALKPGLRALLYFQHKEVKGVWGVAEVVEVSESREPVHYWVENPAGYPLQVRLRLLQPVELAPTPTNPLNPEVFDGVKPLRKEELAALGASMFRPTADRWSILLFGDEPPATYSSAIFDKILDEYTLRNVKPRPAKPRSHDEVVDMIAEIGRMQGKFVEKEVEIDGKRIDVAWKRIARGVPYAVFEVSIEGDLYADLVKLKHAIDAWNSIAVLVTTAKRRGEAERWISGAFHEVKQYFRVIEIEDLVQLYERKRQYKELENKLGLL